MKNMFLGLLVVCAIPDILQTIRPGAEWTLRGNTLEWLDTIQARPTLGEIQTAIQTCQANLITRNAQRQQARLDVKNTGLTQAQRLQALLILLDFDQ